MEHCTVTAGSAYRLRCQCRRCYLTLSSVYTQHQQLFTAAFHYTCILHSVLCNHYQYWRWSRNRHIAGSSYENEARPADRLQCIVVSELQRTANIASFTAASVGWKHKITESHEAQLRGDFDVHVNRYRLSSSSGLSTLANYYYLLMMTQQIR